MRTQWQRTLPGLVVSLALCFGVGWLGSRFTPGDWYGRLVKPLWTPLNGVFAPVWSALYAMMAVAAWLVWKREGLRKASVPLAVFALQLVLNAAWSWLFFGLHRPALAFADIALLWAVILVTLILFSRRSVAAGALMGPYLAWVTFAAVLNYALWQLNR
jgi:benzodiazapine receptor